MNEHGLQLAVHKTELVLATKKRVPRVVPMLVDNQVIETAPAVRYLGVMIDSKLTFWNHISKIADRAARIVNNLSRLMANIGGPSPLKRKLLMRVAESVIVYGAEIWSVALGTEMYRKRINSVHRRAALRITSAYRTVSGPAVLVIAGAIPIYILAKERRRIYLRKDEHSKIRVKREERDRSLLEWQEEWEREHRGRWTARLIKQLKPWLSREHGEVNYYITMFLSGHGYYEAYLHRMGISPSSRCRYCDDQWDDVQHTFFACLRWRNLRRLLETKVGVITPDNVVDKMLSSRESWAQIAVYISELLKTKKEEEPRRLVAEYSEDNDE